MKHIVSFSTGTASAIVAERVLYKYGPDDVEIVFMDTLIEDEDNYRFLEDMRERWLKIFGVDIVILTDGRTPYQVAEDHNMIPNWKMARCTFELKLDIFYRYIKSLCTPITVYIGFDVDELHRCQTTYENVTSFGWGCDFPLLWKPLEKHSYYDICKNELKINPPRMYDWGHTHANCGGVCVKQSQTAWLRTLYAIPKRYIEREEWEQDMMHKLWDDYGKKHTILRVSRNGCKVCISLRELRIMYEKGQLHSSVLKRLETIPPCLTCGMGDMCNKDQYEKMKI